MTDNRINMTGSETISKEKERDLKRLSKLAANTPEALNAEQAVNKVFDAWDSFSKEVNNAFSILGVDPQHVASIAFEVRSREALMWMQSMFEPAMQQLMMAKIAEIGQKEEELKGKK